jgi:hypothetical protein
MSEQNDRYEQVVSDLQENLSLFDPETALPEQKAILNLSNALCQLALAIREDFQELRMPPQSLRLKSES